MNRTRHPRRTAADRGAALIVTIVLVAVLAVIGLALVNRTTNEMQSVSAKRHYDSTVSCADGAQALIRSQLQSGSSTLTLSTTVNDAVYTTGHYDSFTVASVAPVPGTSTSSSRGDMANRVGDASSNKSYRATVVCKNSANPGHQMEVDVLFSFGL